MGEWNQISNKSCRYLDCVSRAQYIIKIPQSYVHLSRAIWFFHKSAQAKINCELNQVKLIAYLIVADGRRRAAILYTRTAHTHTRQVILTGNTKCWFSIISDGLYSYTSAPASWYINAEMLCFYMIEVPINYVAQVPAVFFSKIQTNQNK
jgi:hypothetical protein